MGRRIDLTGQAFGRLTVKGLNSERSKFGEARWDCECECGITAVVKGYMLRSGRTRSCGCFMREQSVERERAKGHGMRNTPAWFSWHCMLARCYNRNHDNYKHYGARGIRVCDKWLRFKGFYRDMGDRPDGMTLGRLNNDENYCKENCEWQAQGTQQRNRRSNKMLTFNRQTMCLVDWETQLSVRPGTIGARLRRGWPVERALTEPVKEWRR